VGTKSNVQIAKKYIMFMQRPFGFTKYGKPLHVVCGERKEKLIIITVYIPLPPKFKNPYERG
jgi:hypothetical protein